MIQSLPIRDRDEAVVLGSKLLERGYIKHVENKGFKDDGGFYFFQSKESISEKAQNREFQSPEVTPDDFEILQTVGKGGFAMVCIFIKNKISIKVLINFINKGM